MHSLPAASLNPSVCGAADEEHSQTVGEDIVIAQLTVRDGRKYNAVVNAQGRTMDGRDNWKETDIEFEFGSDR